MRILIRMAERGGARPMRQRPRRTHRRRGQQRRVCSHDSGEAHPRENVGDSSENEVVEERNLRKPREIDLALLPIGHAELERRMKKRPRYFFELNDCSIKDCNLKQVTAASIVPWWRGNAVQGGKAEDQNGDAFYHLALERRRRDRPLPTLQSLGGKVESWDKSWQMTALREFEEESGYVISSKTLFQTLMPALERRSPPNTVIYDPSSKHLYWFLELTRHSKLREEMQQFNFENVHDAEVSEKRDMTLSELQSINSAKDAIMAVRGDTLRVVCFHSRLLVSKQSET